ncbi:MAG TPA: hypothetical protein VF814_20130 [Casimicrobiaceae bacterium]
MLAIRGKAIASASDEEIVEGVRLRLAAPGSLVVFKAFADRPQYWLDIEGIVVKSARLIDWSGVRADLAALLELKGDVSAFDRLDKVLADHSVR